MELIWASAVTGAFSILALLIEKGRRENNRDHGIVRERLDALREGIEDIDADVDYIAANLDGHIEDHEWANVFKPNSTKDKPSKKVSSPTGSAPKIDAGALVLYVGATPSVRHECPECGKITGRGMLREFKSVLYCSRGCVAVVRRAAEVQPA